MYTQNDLKNLQKAILDLAQGTRVVQVQFGEQLIKYQATDLDQLRCLENDIKRQINGRPRQWRLMSQG